MHPYQTEQALAAALARRQEDAAEQLVREYGGLLNAVVRRHAPGLDADDILADALLAIWQNAGRFDGQHSFRAWAAAVARYRAIDAVRRAARTRPAGGAQEMERLAGHTADEFLRWSWKICSAACPPRTAPFCWAGIFTAAPRPNWPPRAASAWAL